MVVALTGSVSHTGTFALIIYASLLVAVGMTAADGGGP